MARANCRLRKMKFSSSMLFKPGVIITNYHPWFKHFDRVSVTSTPEWKIKKCHLSLCVFLSSHKIRGNPFQKSTSSSTFGHWLIHLRRRGRYILMKFSLSFYCMHYYGSLDTELCCSYSCCSYYSCCDHLWCGVLLCSVIKSLIGTNRVLNIL